MLEGQNIIVLDLETARSADDCRHCGQPLEMHYDDGACESWGGEKPADHITQFFAVGWNNKPALGLSIGCYWDYGTERIQWFDNNTLDGVLWAFAETRPLLVSFNGIGFDFPLMRGLIRRQAEVLDANEDTQIEAASLVTLCDTFKAQCATSYDILAEIWKVDPANKFRRGLNSLDVIAQASGLGPKLSHGAQAPRDWRASQYAKVLNYCQDDAYKTKDLFEMICVGKPLFRGDGLPIILPRPAGVETP